MGRFKLDERKILKKFLEDLNLKVSIVKLAVKAGSINTAVKFAVELRDTAEHWKKQFGKYSTREIHITDPVRGGHVIDFTDLVKMCRARYRLAMAEFKRAEKILKDAKITLED